MTNEEINFKTEEKCTDCKWEGTLVCEFCVADTSDFEKKQSNSDEDCISRQAVLDCIRDNYRRWFINDDAFMQCVNEIKNIVPVTPKPMTGHWIDSGIYGEIDGQITKAYTCSKCGAISIFRVSDGHIINADNCPNCGAKMAESEG